MKYDPYTVAVVMLTGAVVVSGVAVAAGLGLAAYHAPDLARRALVGVERWHARQARKAAGGAR